MGRGVGSPSPPRALRLAGDGARACAKLGQSDLRAFLARRGVTPYPLVRYRLTCRRPASGAKNESCSARDAVIGWRQGTVDSGQWTVDGGERQGGERSRGHLASHSIALGRGRSRKLSGFRLRCAIVTVEVAPRSTRREARAGSFCSGAIRAADETCLDRRVTATRQAVSLREARADCPSRPASGSRPPRRRSPWPQYQARCPMRCPERVGLGFL